MAQSTNDSVRSTLLALLEAEAEAHGVDIVEVEVVGAQKSPTVRVRIDHADEDAEPITLDEVGVQTGWISDLIDEADPIEGAYFLEVSSPGLSRPLRKRRDYERFAGENVTLSTTATEGRRKYTGRLEGLFDDQVRVACDEGTFDIPFDEVRACKIKPNFDPTPTKGGNRKGQTKNKAKR